MKKRASTKPAPNGNKPAPKTSSPCVELKIRPAKGRPMLVWVGKRPLSRVTAFPAQKLEAFGSEAPASDLWSDWPAASPRSGLLLHGDNKEALAHLLANGFRSKVNLIYIDPPFDSAADYVRRVSLRGASGTARLGGEDYSLGEQVQYTDIWANDNYLQYMYERLLLSRELLSENGIFVLHCDWRKAHHLRCMLDEVLGADAFRNEIYWYFYNKMHDVRKEIFPRATNTLLVYAKGDNATFHRLASPRDEVVKQLKRVKVDGVLVNLKDEEGGLVYQESDSKTLDNIWAIPLIPPADVKQKTDYPTQKPEALLELVLLSYSNPGDIVLDYCAGSGTTAVVAQRLGRRWIGCDINRGSIQTTSKRLVDAITTQVKAAKQPDLLGGGAPVPAQMGFTVYRVNDYDLHLQHVEAVNLACEHIGVERTRTDSFFDGTLGRALVKIIPLEHPLTPLDLEEVRKELEARPDEDRPVTLVCLGIETSAKAWLEDWNRLRKSKDGLNRIDVVELRTDPKFGKFIAHQTAKARVKIVRKGGKIAINIEDFISPSILERLSQQAGILKPKIEDWRSMVDCVLIDPEYDGKVFHVRVADIPEDKNSFVAGSYEVEGKSGRAAIKIIDMLGEEVLIVETSK